MSIIELDDKIYEKFNQLYNKANEFFQNNNFQKSFELSNQCYEYSLEKNNSTLMVKSLILMSSSLFYINQFEVAIDKLNSALFEAKKLDKKYSIDVFNAFFNIYLKSGDFKQAYNYAQKAFLLADEFNGIDKKTLGLIYNNLGNANYYLGEYIEAEKKLLEALEIRKEYDSKAMIANSLNNIGVLYTAMGKLYEAKDVLIEALDIRINEDCKNEYIAETSSNLANVYDELGMYNDALPLHIKAFEIDSEIYGSDSIFIVNDLESLGNNYLLCGKIDEALEIFKKAYHIRGNNGQFFKPEMMFVLDKLAEIFFIKEDYKSAQPVVSEMLVIQEGTLGKNHPGIIPTIENMLLIYQNLGDELKAKQMYELLINISSEKVDNLLNI